MIARIVRFRSALSQKEIMETFEERAGRYREARGLRQKYYLRFPETGEYGAVYLWDSVEDVDAFARTGFPATIREAYRVEGEVHAEITEVVLVLHPDSGSAPGEGLSAGA